jgi:Leucine-rich repeat (LRR) protein
MTEQEIFEQAIDKPCEERAAFLETICGGDTTLRRRLQALLRSHTEATRFLDVSAVEQLAAVAKTRDDLTFLSPPSEPGALGRLDHYEILEIVGRGGMGIVLRARDTKLERVVAIKVLAPLLAISASARQRFVREARAAAAITHDHVIAIYAVEDAGPVPYLVMQFIDGPTLQAKIDRTGPLALTEVLRIGLQIAEGLAAAHRQGLIHRDIKPANILLENGVQRVKITDFGLAHAVDKDSQVPSGFIAGTPAYMSPEQAHGEHVDHRSDLFSLGTVLYALCTGQTPFQRRTTIEVLQAVREDTPRPVREVTPDVPEWLSELIARLHAKDPAGRPASAQEVAESLAAGSPQRQLPLLLPTAAAAARPRTANRPWRWAAAAAVVLVASLGLTEATGVTDVRRSVIRLFSPEGTLVVEVDDPGVSVIVDGGDVVITGAGAKEIRLKPGQYKVEASKDGKVVRQELVTVNRNGRQIVRISQDAPAVTAAEAWEKSVAALPVEKQVEAVERRLRELNPEFRGKVEGSIRNGKVWRLGFLSDRVTDISPVRALKGLESLDCGGSAPRKGRLSDLTPLRGLRLVLLSCTESQVSDLEPLRGMPLEYLHCRGTGVDSLSPLEGMKLVSLTINGTPVSDLSPLRGMPLKWLDLAEVRGVTNLVPLEGMPLEYLNVAGTALGNLDSVSSLKSLRWLLLDGTRITTLEPLRPLRLERISLFRTGVTDLTPIQGMPLKQLRLDYRPDREQFVRSFKELEFINDKPVGVFWKETETAWEKSVAALAAEQQVEAVVKRLQELNPRFDGRVEPTIKDGVVIGLAFNTDLVSDLSPVRALTRLESLDCNGTAERHGSVADLSPLRGLPLKRLVFTDNHVTDLSPLRGMPLKQLGFARNLAVRDLTPLQGLPLEFLDCSHTAVADLSSLKGMKLTTLWCDQTFVSDLAPLRGMPLTWLSVAYCRRVIDLSPLKGMPLQRLSWIGTAVSDTSPLQGMPLKDVHCEFQRERDAKFLRSFKTLETINLKPAAEFWKEVDGK